LQAFRHKPGSGRRKRRFWLCGFREVARCYTIGPGIVTPEIVASSPMATRVDAGRAGLASYHLFLI
jgi:hypothetical protein